MNSLKLNKLANNQLSEKEMNSICGGAEILLPFNYGMFKKDSYNNWITSIKGMANK